ncbi:MAG: putative CRISPR-associated protein [Rectinema subterraneum]
MQKILICTVGTSFFQGNLARLSSGTNNDANGGNIDKLAQAYNANDWNALARAMLDISPASRILGAEVNTIEFMLSRVRSENERISKIIFLVSDTEDGINTGNVLKSYYTERAKKEKELCSLQVDYRIIKDLQDADPNLFKKSGLLNLVRAISQVIREAGDPRKVIIDATGGYKAQIAIAVMFGQALGIDVIYKHERFSTIIDFPPMPVALDFSYFEQFNDLFAVFYYEFTKIMTFAEFSSFFESEREISTYSELSNNEDFSRIKLFFDIEEIDGNYLFSMNYAGFIYTEAALRMQWQFKNSKTTMPAVSPSERKVPRLKDDHYPIGFKEYIERIWQNELWIATIISMPYDKQRGIKNRGFYIRKIKGENQIIGYYRDKNNFGARFRILTGAAIEHKLLRIALFYLNSKVEEFG